MEQKLDSILGHIIEIKVEQARQGEQIDRNTEDLTEHKEGVMQNRARIECIEKGKERTKGAIKVITILFSVFAAVSGVAIAVYNLIVRS